MNRAIRSIPYRPFGTFRLFLAMLVVLQHYVLWSGVTWKATVVLLEPGSIAVLVFFFLSGFVVTEAAELIYTNRPGAFLMNRVLRIWPLFAVAVLVSFATLFVLSGYTTLTDETGTPLADPFSDGNLVRNLAMILPLPGRLAMEPDVSVLRIAWALRVEMAFYFGMAILLLVCMLGKRVTLHAAFSLASAVLLLLVIYYVTARPAWNSILMFAPFFCAGGAFFFALRGSWFDWVILSIAMVLSVIVTALTRIEAGKPFFWPTFLFVVLVLACLFLAIRTTRTHAVDRRLGDYSYPVYVGHWLPLLVFVALRQSYPSYSPVMAGTLLIAFGLGLPLAYYHFIEPMTARLRLAVRGVAIR